MTGFCDDTTWIDIPYVKLIYKLVGYVMTGMTLFPIDESTTNKWNMDPIQVPVGPITRA